MKKLFLTICTVLFIIAAGYGQYEYSSRNGNTIPPKIKMRFLNIFINIIYDQTPERDPLRSNTEHPWQPGEPNSINSRVPTFLKNFMDTDLNDTLPDGWITRYFYESSLGNFICLADYIIVNISQSYITPESPGKDFSAIDLINHTIKLINEKGGVKTVFGHDSISDYDFFERGSAGRRKKIEPNGKVDYIQFIFRNTCRVYENGKQIYNYGQNNPGEGNFITSSTGKGNMLKFGKTFYENEMYSFQNIGMLEYTNPGKSILIHEFAHSLFGGNEFHTSGGNHYGTYSAGPFIGLQGGWGIMGGAASSLISCNAYERWRLGWTSIRYNPYSFPIAANGKPSDINKSMGSQTFILRDFVTTGDAIRIRLPYTDEKTSNQYIWLENHQIGKNNKYDFLQFSNTSSCRDMGTPGIYCYIQVGRDILESNDYKDVFPMNETDNLRVVSAKGNWDMQVLSLTDTVNCVAWRSVQHSELCYKPNPLSGYTDQQSHFFDTENKLKSISDQGLFEFPSIIYRKGKRYDNLPYLGDNFDAFTDGAVMDIGTNPAPVNLVTCYVNQGAKKFKKANINNTRHVYLSGLYIKMKDLKNGTFEVNIGWDDYTVKNDVRWTGNIVLQEKLILQKGKTILLDQNYTPNQLERDSISGFFAPPTTFEMRNGSIAELMPKSKMIIDNGSALILEPGCTLVLHKNAQIILKKNARMEIRQGAVLDNRGGKIIRKSNAIITGQMY